MGIRTTVEMSIRASPASASEQVGNAARWLPSLVDTTLQTFVSMSMGMGMGMGQRGRFECGGGI